MRKKYRDKISDEHPLDVYSVSNQHYARHLAGYEDDYIPMAVVTTGIPALRAFSLQLPAVCKFSTLRQHCEGPLRSFISSLEIWSSKSASKRRLELRKIVEKPCKVRTLLVYYEFGLTGPRRLISTSQNLWVR